MHRHPFDSMNDLLVDQLEDLYDAERGRTPANETEVNPSQKVRSAGGKGASQASAQSSGKQNPGTVTEQTCANCGMRQDEWRTPQGYQQDGETFCCEGCATERVAPAETGPSEIERRSATGRALPGRPLYDVVTFLSRAAVIVWRARAIPFHGSGLGISFESVSTV